MTHEDIAAALADLLADESEVTLSLAVEAVAEVLRLEPSAASMLAERRRAPNSCPC